MGETSSSRDWAEICPIYGLLFVLAICLTYFNLIRFIFEHFLSLTSIPTGSARLSGGFTGWVIGLSALSLFFAAANFFISPLTLHDSQSASRNAGGNQSIIGIGGIGGTTIRTDDCPITVTVGPTRRASESASSNFAGSQSVVGIGGIGETDIQLTRGFATVTVDSTA